MLGCGNAGENRVLAIQATGSVTGLVYLDRNGNRRPDGADTVLGGVGIRLVADGTRDTAARAMSDPQGGFTMPGVLIGHYAVVVDTATIGDSVDVVRIDTSAVTLTHADSADTLSIAISFPIVTIAEARLLPVGTRAFIQGVALTNGQCIVTCTFTFGDSTVHVADATGAIRATRVKVTLGNPVGTGDSVRFLGTRATAVTGQAIWDNVTPYVFQSFLPQPVATLTTNALAKTANGGLLDAAFVRIPGDTIVDTLTIQAGADSGSFRVRAVDGSDTLVILLDPTFAFPVGFGTSVPGGVKQFAGVLVPDSAGSWRLKPRGSNDITP